MTRTIRRLVAVALLCVSGVGVVAHSPLQHSAGLECGPGGRLHVAGGPGHLVGRARVSRYGWGTPHGGCS